MELFPAMRWGWLNGWLLLSILFLVFGLLLAGFSRDIVAKLYDVSGWRRHQRVVSALGKLAALACFVLFIGTPLKIGEDVLVVGLALCVVGIVVMSAALRIYNRTPPGEMVTRGLYRVSRNPQWLGMAAMLLGTCVAIGSWTAVALFLASAVGYHFRLLGEETACLAQYGTEYGDFMKRVPRYLFL
jgi:protein-S-isoprenylcysteine O-methyltransferase Ste14